MPAPVPLANGPHDDGEEPIDYSDIEAKYRIHADDSLENILVVDGVPIIDKPKLEKLLTKLCKEFSRKGAPVKPEDIYMPWDSTTGKSKGYLFIELRNADEATVALGKMNGYPFDSKHTFRVNRLTDIERYADMEEGFLEPKSEPYKPREHLRAWLADSQGRDQYATYRGDEPIVHWHGKPSQCEIAHKKTKLADGGPWTEVFVSWSPQGTYLATVHKKGVRLWGGPSFEVHERFAHPRVIMIDFSPCEQYLVTYSMHPIIVPEGAEQGPRYCSREDEGNQLAVWEIKSGHLLRTFPAITQEEDGSQAQQQVKKQMMLIDLKWSPDDKYVARVTPGQQISVYELPSMGLHGKKSLKIEGVVDFKWCPLGEKDREEAEKTKGVKKTRENMLAYWTPEVANQPARVTLMNFPSRIVLRQKNLFNVSDCWFYWQNQGDFLCVKVDRHTKTKKTLFCNLEIFRVREKDYPVEVIELKDQVLDFSWEPKGERFAIISTNDPNQGNTGPGVSIKTDISFYQLHRQKGDFRLLRTLTGKVTNQIRWSPRGRFVVLATVGSATKSELQFWDLDFNVEDVGRATGGGGGGKDTQKDKDEWGSGIQYLGTADHYGVTDLEWDPSGRYLATSASAWRHTLENGYAIWDFRGQEVEKHVIDRFKQFLWRPRPATLLTKEQQRMVRKNLREYGRHFEEEDAADETTVSAELVVLRKRLLDEWNAWRGRCRKEMIEEMQRGGRKVEEQEAPEEVEKEEIEVWVDELIDQIEEEVE